ncbi:MAG: 4Fe-4S dicluster domain-containing protein [Acidobacteria bacterium]|nr:4Fe-4S dicluster domain-containing protein [Acidobacteriota bacterium]
MTSESKAMLIDITKCIGCRACEESCKQIHGFPQAHETGLSATALTVVQERGDKFVRRLCMHCQDPACVSVCPVGALKKTAQGAVRYAGGKCIGCRYCMIACPFEVPKYEWSKLAPYVTKCDLCADRVLAGKPTACSEVCPTGATLFGDRDDLLAEAHKRIAENRTYVRKIYGETEVGGTSIFYISDVAFEDLGVTTAPMSQPLPTLSAAALGEVPTVVLVGGSLLSGLYWFTQRRQAVAAAEVPRKPRAHPVASMTKGPKP